MGELFARQPGIVSHMKNPLRLDLAKNQAPSLPVAPTHRPHLTPSTGARSWGGVGRSRTRATPATATTHRRRKNRGGRGRAGG